MDVSLDIENLGLSERADAWLRLICINTIEECMNVPIDHLLAIDVRDADLLIEIAQKLNEYGIHYSDWDDFL